MKKNIFIIVALLAGIGLTYALFFKGNADALQVNQVAADPAAYSGPVTVTGIMAGMSQQDPTVFGMFDLKELQCKMPNCNKLYLPVKSRAPCRNWVMRYASTAPLRSWEVATFSRPPT